MPVVETARLKKYTKPSVDDAAKTTGDIDEKRTAVIAPYNLPDIPVYEQKIIK